MMYSNTDAYRAKWSIKNRQILAHMLFAVCDPWPIHPKSLYMYRMIRIQQPKQPWPMTVMRALGECQKKITAFERSIWIEFVNKWIKVVNGLYLSLFCYKVNVLITFLEGYIIIFIQNILRIPRKLSILIFS